MIIYYRGSSSSFEKTWTSYKEDVSNSNFTTEFKFDKNKNFEDLSNNFQDINHLKIAKSIHGTKIAIYHIMINFSEN